MSYDSLKTDNDLIGEETRPLPPDFVDVYLSPIEQVEQIEAKQMTATEVRARMMSPFGGLEFPSYRTFTWAPNSKILTDAVLPGSTLLPTKEVEPPKAVVESPGPKYSHCSHMAYALPRAAADSTIAELCAALTGLDFDTIAFRGISGTIMAPVIAHIMHKEMILVRKRKGADCASGKWVEGYRHAKRYIVLDDLVSSGSSAIDTIVAVRAFTKNQAQLIKIVTYDRGYGLKIAGPGDLLGSNGTRYDSIMHQVETEWATGRPETDIGTSLR